MAMHSPAPWRLDQITNQAYVVSSVRGEVVVEFRYTGDQVPTAANAWLTVAAPDMLAALQRQRDNIKRWLETGVPASPEESKSISDQIDAAIAKAEGRS